MGDANRQSTLLSRWVYRALVFITFSSAVFTTRLFYNIFMDTNAALFSPNADWSVGIIAMWGVFEMPLILIGIGVALVLRSGGAVWLFGMWAVLSAVPIAVPVATNVSDIGFLALFLAFVAVPFALICAMFWYVVRTGEIRRP